MTQFLGEGDYTQAVIWLDKADSIPLASADVREGIKVSRVVVQTFTVKLTQYEDLITNTFFFIYLTQMIMVRCFPIVCCLLFD